MPTTISTALKPAFLKTVQELVQQRDNLAGASIQFKKMWVDFCVDYTKAYDEARSLGNDAVKHLNDSVGINDPAVLSKMRQVASIKHALSSKVLAALPPSREAIVDLARAEISKSGTISKLVDAKKVTADLSVREIRRLLKKPSRAAQASNIHGGSRVTVTFPSGSDAVEPLAALLLNSDATVAVSDDRLRDAIKAKLGKEQWEKIGARLTQ